MIELPTKVAKATTINPRKLFVFSQTKVGKTSNLVQLPNALLIDLENGSEFVDGMKINVVQEAVNNKISILNALKMVTDQIKAMDHKYDYIIIDTATALEKLAKELAAILYRQSNIGKGWKGADMYTLPNGAGYNWVRQAFEQIYSAFDGLATKCLIIAGHIKIAAINKDGKSLQARDIQLTGKLKLMVSADSDAIGFLYRNKETDENILSFKTSEQDLATGARSAHLRGKEFVISKYDPDTDTLTTFWDKIFI